MHKFKILGILVIFLNACSPATATLPDSTATIQQATATEPQATETIPNPTATLPQASATVTQTTPAKLQLSSLEPDLFPLSVNGVYPVGTRKITLEDTNREDREVSITI